MAGAGSKLFTDGSVLNAAQVNTYLMDQSIMRFATTTARDAAFGGAGEPTLAEGMTCYIDADNTIYTYDGSAWVKMVSASTPPAMELVKTYSIVSGQATQTVSGAFSASFVSYRVVIENTVMSSTASNTFVYCKMHDGTNPASSNYQFGFARLDIAASAVSGFTQQNGVNGTIIGAGTGDKFGTSFDIVNPNLATHTIFPQVSAVNVSTGYVYIGAGMHQTSTAYTGFQLIVSTGTFTSGTVLVYGYRNS